MEQPLGACAVASHGYPPSPVRNCSSAIAGSALKVSARCETGARSTQSSALPGGSHLVWLSPRGGSSSSPVPSSNRPQMTDCRASEACEESFLSGGHGLHRSMEDWKSNFENKIIALSRRTAAEIHRAERERGQQGQRLDNLETWCREKLASTSSAAMVMLQERVDSELGKISEAIEQVRREGSTVQASLAALAKRVDRGDDFGSRHHAAVSSRIREPQEERSSWESALERERKEVRQLISAGSSELMTHLNSLREQLREQRSAAEAHVHQSDGWRQSLSAGAALEVQVAELGGVLAARLQAKITSLSDALNAKIADARREFQQSVRATASPNERMGVDDDFSRVESKASGAVAAGTLEDIHWRFQRDLDEALETTKDDVRTVHLEVMSVDTRLAALEERLRHRYISPTPACREIGSSPAANMKGSEGTTAAAFANSTCSGQATGIVVA